MLYRIECGGSKRIIINGGDVVSYQALTQPSSIGRVLDSGFKLFAASLKPVLALTIFAAIVNIIMQYSMMQAMTPMTQLATEEDMAQYMATMWPQIMAFSVIAWLVSIVIYNAILSRVGNISKGNSDELYDSLVVGLRKALPVFIGAILYTLAVTVGFVLLLIPGLILMVTLMFFQIMIVVEDEGIIASLKSSHSLIWGNYWRTTAVIMIPFFVIDALFMVAAFVAGFMGAMDGMVTAEGQVDMSFGVFDIIVAIISVFMVPLMDSIFVAQANDLKLRKSGSDLEQRMSD